jgi:hypothetical protein
MSKRKCNAASRLRQLESTHQELKRTLSDKLPTLEDQLYNLTASYRFYDCAIRHMTEPDHLEESDDWHFGLFLYQQYLQQQADKVMEGLINIKRLAH